MLCRGSVLAFGYSAYGIHPFYERDADDHRDQEGMSQTIAQPTSWAEQVPDSLLAIVVRVDLAQE